MMDNQYNIIYPRHPRQVYQKGARVCVYMRNARVKRRRTPVTFDVDRAQYLISFGHPRGDDIANNDSATSKRGIRAKCACALSFL
jgi:hypothetical protein